MTIAILGTRGIPNNYGGFEQFAEFLSTRLVKKGYDVTVYNPNFHPFDGSEFRGVRIKKVNSPDWLLGSGAANYVYDYRCLKDALAQEFDIIYEAGYASCAISLSLLRSKKKKSIVVTNMDGMEWQRDKWSGLIKFFIRLAESRAVRESDYLIADNIGIKNYFEETYKVTPELLFYGAEEVTVTQTHLGLYRLIPFSYYLIIARLEPENNIELMVEGVLKAESGELYVVGGTSTKYGQLLKMKYSENKRIHFLGAIYDKEVVDCLRFYSKFYLHGHSVGGTNPSLLEAMAASSFIIAHDNAYNRSILGEDAYYFSTSEHIQLLLTDTKLQGEKTKLTSNNLKKIKTSFNWDRIADEHEVFFQKIFSLRKG
jgi:glycosyltransferase involved in cell wall biosynthesis